MTASEPERSRLAEKFSTSAAGVAGDLRDACLPLLPVLQGRILRVDELNVTAGLERQSPFAAAAMALGPAVAAAGAGISSLGLLAPAQATTMVGVAASVVETALDALDVLRGHGGGVEPDPDFAHRLAHTTHLASELAGARSAAGRPPRAPVLWAGLLQSLSTRIRLARQGRDGPGAAAWMSRVGAASACRDAAAHGIGAHAGRAPSPTERLIRCLTFASLYAGFAMLERPTGAHQRAPARVDTAAADRARMPSSLRGIASRLLPDPRGAVAL
jgi:hypothetical protein